MLFVNHKCFVALKVYNENCFYPFCNKVYSNYNLNPIIVGEIREQSDFELGIILSRITDYIVPSCYDINGDNNKQDFNSKSKYKVIDRNEIISVCFTFHTTVHFLLPTLEFH